MCDTDTIYPYPVNSRSVTSDFNWVIARCPPWTEVEKLFFQRWKDPPEFSTNLFHPQFSGTFFRYRSSGILREHPML